MKIALAAVCLGGLKYLHTVYYSQEKWFHLGFVAMATFAAIQVQQFMLNQSQIDSKIDSLRQRSQQ